VSSVGIIGRQEHPLDIGSPNRVPLWDFKLRHKTLEKIARLGQRIDRPRIHRDARCGQGRVSGGKLDGDHPAQAVTYEDRLRNLELTAEPGNIVGKCWDIVTVLRLVTVATTSQIQCGHSMRRFKVVELRLEEGVVTTPAVYEHQGGIATAFLLVI
jgi:hypothetical protein